MSDLQKIPAITFPYPDIPGPSQTLEIAPGILWVRMVLPFRLNHVNVYLLEEAGGYAVVDTGLGNTSTIEAWKALLDGPLQGKKITRLIATHCHPDHVGLAGWMAETFNTPLFMSMTEYLLCLSLHKDPGSLAADHYKHFYASNGLDAETVKLVMTQGHGYLRIVTGLPATFTRLIAGETLDIGGRHFEVLTGGGHSPEQIMLYCDADNILLSADQVLSKISPNISVSAVDPHGDPLGIFLRSLRNLKRDMPHNVLVLPGHGVPFFGLHNRVDELIQHHEDRCGDLARACVDKPMSAAELVPVIFHRELDPHQMSFAFTEVMAHINYMVRERQLAWAEPMNGIQRLRTI